LADNAQLIADLKAALAKADAELVSALQDLAAIEAAIDQAQAIADQLGGEVDQPTTIVLEGLARASAKGTDIIPRVDAAPGVILARDHVTAPQDLPVGSALDTVTITGVIRTLPKPDNKYRKAHGADATAGKQGGFCVGLTGTGQLEAWVDDGIIATPRTLVLPLSAGAKSFFAVRIAIDSFKLWGAAKTAAKELPNGRKPFDGIAVVGAGIWGHAKCDPITGAELVHLKVYNTPLTDEQIEADRDGWAADIDQPAYSVTLDQASMRSAGGDLGLPVGPGNGDYMLEPDDPSATRIGISVDDQQRPPFVAWGWGCGSPKDQETNVVAQLKQHAQMLFGDINVTLMRINSPALAYKPMVDVGLANGVKHIHCTCYSWQTTDSPEAGAKTIVDGVKAAIKGGIPITSVSPSGEPAAESPYWSPAQYAPRMLALRAEMDGQGLQAVQLIPPEFASWDDEANRCYDALKAGNALKVCAAGAGHSYNMCPGPDGMDARWLAAGLGIWQLELGSHGMPSTGGRIAHNLGRGCTVKTSHQGIAEVYPENARDNSQKLVKANGQPNPWYWTYRACSTSWLAGTRARGFASDFPASGGLSATQAKYLHWSYGRKPPLTFGCGQRADGNWVIVAQNYTSGAGGGAGENSIFPAQKIQVTATIKELRGTNLPWAGLRVIVNGGVAETEAAMVDGQLRFTLGPGELGVLVSG
jgi:hypothetical protein